jgi:hypothetical protein
MRLLPYLLSFYLPLCGTAGAAGIAPPGVVDFAHLHLQGHSEFFSAPAGFSPTAEAVTRVYKLPPAQLFAAIRGIAAAEPRTYPLDNEPDALQAAWVVRSAGGNFPDIVEIAVLAAPGGSSFVFYSHAVYGWSDYGVNARRAKKWVDLLDMKVAE